MPAPRRKTRQNSNVFHMLSKSQIVQLREAFNLLDGDGDSRISAQDLAEFLESTGLVKTPEEVAEMVEELGPSGNFMMLLTCIGERIAGISSEREIYEWLRLFDDDDDGEVDEELLRFWMTSKGEGLARADYEYLVRGCVDGGRVSLRRLASKMRHGEVLEQGAGAEQQ